MFKRNNSGKNSPIEEVSPIDEDEQSKIAEEIKKQADSQSVTTRSIFRYLFVAIAVIHAVCFLYSIFFPYTMEHQKHFVDLVPIYGFVSSYCGSIYCYIISSLIVQGSLQRVHPVLLNIAYLIAAFTLIAWGVVFHNLHITNPLFFWLPLSNIAGIALAQYIDKDTKDMISSAAGLEQYKYNVKGV
mmetsp:Transcript_45665/g.79845  ORF Transcript_45665/g.79845 Transcript_45665/m.79845 type:complete len:186 (-) Transcript_45665:88-645(-)